MIIILQSHSQNISYFSKKVSNLCAMYLKNTKKVGISSRLHFYSILTTTALFYYSHAFCIFIVFYADCSHISFRFLTWFWLLSRKSWFVHFYFKLLSRILTHSSKTTLTSAIMYKIITLYNYNLFNLSVINV